MRRAPPPPQAVVGVPGPDPSPQGGRRGPTASASALGITCCELLKTKPRARTGHPREGLAFLGWELQMEVPRRGLWLLLLRATRAAGFPRELASGATPSLTEKSSLPKIPHAAGKREKGQNDVGVHVINHLVHKNCLITGKIWKSIYCSEQLTRGLRTRGSTLWSCVDPPDLGWLQLHRKERNL